MKKKLTLFLAIVMNITISHAQWELTGNSITNSNFLGSTNAKPLVFKVNNQLSGFMDYDNTKANTSFGYQTLLSNTGYGNSAIGYQALFSNTSGFYNNALGLTALYSNTTGSQNSAFGFIALNHNTSGYNNTAFGVGTLWANTIGNENVASGLSTMAYNISGNYNVAYGGRALFNNTSGSNNTALGFQSLNSNTTVSNLTAVGHQALYSNTSGVANTANGYQALYSNTIGPDNTAVGYQALYSNTSGAKNIATGYQALYSNTTGTENIAVGHSALYANTVGYNNVAIGSSSLTLSDATGNTAIGIHSCNNNTIGNGNTSVGANSLTLNITGNYNAALGYNAGSLGTNFNHTTSVGCFSACTASYQVRVGDISITSIGGYANWTNISDGRVKKNIKSNIPGLAFINKLQPVSYNLDLDAADKILQRQAIKDKGGKIIPSSKEEIEAKKQKEQIVYTGFVAQDVEKAAKSLNYDFSGVDAAKNTKDLYGLRYSEFVVPLVKAVQELSTQNDSLKDVNKQMQSQLTDLLKRMNAFEFAQKQNNSNISSQSAASNFQTTTINDAGRLEQNSPNPFKNNTTIHYYVPKNTNSAKIIVSDISGNILKDISVSIKGSGQVVISAGTFSSGNYIYSLFIDGKKIDSKQMILTK